MEDITRHLAEPIRPTQVGRQPNTTRLTPSPRVVGGTPANCQIRGLPLLALTQQPVDQAVHQAGLK